MLNDCHCYGLMKSMVAKLKTMKMLRFAVFLLYLFRSTKLYHSFLLLFIVPYLVDLPTYCHYICTEKGGCLCRCLAEALVICSIKCTNQTALYKELFHGPIRFWSCVLQMPMSDVVTE